MKTLLICTVLAILTACTSEPKSDTSNAKSSFVSTCMIGQKLYVIIKTSDIPDDAIVTLALTRWPDIVYSSAALFANNGEQMVALDSGCDEKMQLVLYINNEPRNATALNCNECAD